MYPEFYLFDARAQGSCCASLRDLCQCSPGTSPRYTVYSREMSHSIKDDSMKDRQKGDAPMHTTTSRLKQFLHRIRGSTIEFDLKSYRKILSQINELEDGLRRADEGELTKSAEDVALRARRGVPLDDLLVETFALVREVSWRLIGLRPYDTQVIAGLVLHAGKLSEMQTGEGKTLAAVLPVCLNALTGRGIHVLTFNDYLARRDAEWMGPIYEFMGLTVGFVQEGMDRQERKRAYASDVTYVTAKEAGFDFLRDHLCFEKEDLVHRSFHFAVVDEADSNLIDEARVPLVIAGNVAAPPADPRRLSDIVRGLDSATDFQTDEYSRTVNLTESGLDRVEDILGRGSLHDPQNIEILSQLSHALHAEVLLARDVDYIVRNGRVELVDEFTGRVAEKRRWPHGLQAAVEAKEDLSIQRDGEILGSITLQHFLRLYSKVSGMTATAQSAADEFEEFYDMTVVVIPPNRSCTRVDLPDLVFTHKDAKHRALVAEISCMHATGQPILVGTSSVAESDRLAAALQETGIACQVLNARNDELEAGIVARAGSLYAVTISTNMAGRGTDIRLGGEHGATRDEVIALGGLYVIGTNRHESRRIDDQLRGRAGRQGDLGSSRFFISLTDDLIERYRIQELIPESQRPHKQDSPIDNPVIGREIERAQRIIEGQNFEIRRTLWKYSKRVEEQRKTVSERRQEILQEKHAAPIELRAPEATERYDELCSSVGDDVVNEAIKQITLYHIDRCWSDHLAAIAHIREGTYLFSFSMQNPLDEYHRETLKAFLVFQNRVAEQILRTFLHADITEAGIDIDKEGLRGPASTWTYLISDNPLGDWLNRFFSGIRKAFTKS